MVIDYLILKQKLNITKKSFYLSFIFLFYGIEAQPWYQPQIWPMVGMYLAHEAILKLLELVCWHYTAYGALYYKSQNALLLFFQATQT